MSPSVIDPHLSVSSSHAKRPCIALTIGDPAGVGPELGAKLLADPQNRAKADIFVLADLSEVKAAAAVAGVTIPLSAVAGPDGVQVLDDGSCPATPFTPRKETKEGGERCLHQLRRAMDMANRGEIDAIVFTPLNKTSLHLAGMGELDELHWFAKYFKHDGFHCEINVIEGLWTARVTSHLGIKDVAANVTEKSVADAIELLHTLLYEYGIDVPRIGVCALNPHNGENGIFGREELDAIIPAVKATQSKGINVQGPYPSDTIFLQKSRQNYDGIVTMYHDQGQIAIKMLGFDGGVSVQGGLPVVITTPAHGTAFDIVGQNVASVTSSQNALDVAINVAGRRAAKTKVAV